MADIHNDVESLQKVYDMVQNDGIKMIVLAGDLTINGTMGEQNKMKEVTDKWKIPVYKVPGNHDDYKKVWIFGEKYQSVKVDGIKLLLIDNSNWQGLGTDQKIWIEQESAECKIIKCVAIMHMPLFNTMSKHVMGEYSLETANEAMWLKNILVTNGIVTGYSGHLHYASSYTNDGWETVLVGAISRDRNTQTPRYTEVTLYDDGRVENGVKIITN